MTLDEVIPWGRSFAEYQLIFGLNQADLSGSVLGCGDGPAAFNAEATGLGHRVTSCDPVYAHDAAAVRARVAACYPGVLAQVRANAAAFVWGTHFRDPDHLGECRLAAMDRFLADYEVGRAAGRYVEAALPALPFEDGRFDLALVSHLLFLYSELFDAAFHVAALAELLRVAPEVRVFPLVSLSGRLSPHLDPVREHLGQAGHHAEIVRTGYEFQRADNQAGSWMLRVYRGGHVPQVAGPACEDRAGPVCGPVLTEEVFVRFRMPASPP